jgi:hypothetical protein
MGISYTLQANADTANHDAVCGEFVELFGKRADKVDRFCQSVNISLDFDPNTFARAEAWAKNRGDVEVREFYTREFTDAERQRAPLLYVDFENCYLWPREHKWVPCPGCDLRRDMRVPTGEISNRIEFKHGIGQCEGRLYLSTKAADIIEDLNLRGYDIHPWSKNPSFYELSSTVELPAMLIEGRNVHDLEYPTCPACHRPRFRFYYGPDILDATDYHGEDFVSFRRFMITNLVVTQKAAQRLKDAFPKVEFGDPVLLEHPST